MNSKPSLCVQTTGFSFSLGYKWISDVLVCVYVCGSGRTSFHSLCCARFEFGTQRVIEAFRWGKFRLDEALRVSPIFLEMRMERCPQPMIFINICDFVQCCLCHSLWLEFCVYFGSSFYSNSMATGNTPVIAFSTTSNLSILFSNRYCISRYQLIWCIQWFAVVQVSSWLLLLHLIWTILITMKSW